MSEVDAVLREHGVEEGEREVAEELIRAYLAEETTFRTVDAEVESLTQDEVWALVEDLAEIVDAEDT